jgi:VWFA-related protein
MTRKPCKPSAAGRWPLALALAAMLVAARPAAGHARALAAGGPPPRPAAAAQGAGSGIFAGGGDPFEETIEVNVVSLDVVVRDAAGNLVPGLTRADFRLFVDGKAVEITNFVALQTAPAASGEVQPDAVAATPAAQAPAPPPRHVVLFVDNANMRMFDRNRILKQIRAFLAKALRPDDQVLLVTHDPGLHPHGWFPGEPAVLDPALDQMAREPVMNPLAQMGSESHAASVRETYDSLHHLLVSLGGLDGHKVLIYVGNGLPTHLGRDSYGNLNSQQSATTQAFDTLDLTSPMRRVIADANANLVTLYTLEASGLDAGASAQQQTAGAPGAFAASRQAVIDRQDSLFNLARETGGRAALNGNDFSLDLGRIAEELDAAYSLGFTPARAGEGRSHSIRIEVDRPGVRLSYRSSFFDRTAQERLDSQVDAALIHGQSDNPLAATLKFGTPAPAERGHVLLPVQVRVPFNKLALIPRADGRHGQVEIVFGNLDAQGGMAPLHREQVPLRIPDADASNVLASNMGYDAKLVLAPGRQRLAFVVRDGLARISSCIIQDLDVDKAGTVSMVAPATAAHPSLR